MRWRRPRSLARWSPAVLVFLLAVPTVFVAQPPLPASAHERVARRFVVQSVSFVSATTGYAWGYDVGQSYSRGNGVLARTTDYGRSWHRVHAPRLSVSDAPQSGIVGVSYLTRRVGYLYGRSLWVTTDGGHHWTRRTPPDPINQIVAANGTAWVVTDSCRGAGCRREQDALYRLRSGGRGWRPIRPAQHLDYSASIQSVQNGYVLINDGGQGRRLSMRLHRPGHGWTRHRVPCSFSFVAALIARSSVALVCGSEPGTGYQPTQAWISTDGGLRWQRRGDPGEIGYITSLAVDSPSTWVLVRDRGNIQVSTDSGQHWHYALPGESNARATGGNGWLTVGFTTPTEAIATTAEQDNGDYIATSRNGGRKWQLKKTLLTP